MISGVLYALLAGLMWGLIFVGPLIVPDYPALLQSMGRYLALGLIALPIAWLGRTRLRQLTRKDWSTALSLTLMGNVIYYACLASAIQRTGAPVSTMIIGTLPVVIPLFANVLYSQRDGRLSWRRLAPALFIGLMIAIAVLCSWVGALCWNIASQKLPTVILGPLIVFETLAGLLYTFILRQEIPPFLTLSGIALLVAGVVIAVRAKPEKATVVPVTER
ncbi:DMT family transporter [Salmonella enterica subsp. enterica serovar Montevideo]|nr:DMT family transporter [Salmonella enterica subsp. enterica serovar Montevideo]